MHTWAFYATAEVGGRKYTPAVAQAFLSLETTFATAVVKTYCGCGWLCCMPSAVFDIVLPIGYAVNMTYIGDTYVLYWNCSDDRLYALSSTAGHEPQISMHTNSCLVGRLGG